MSYTLIVPNKKISDKKKRPLGARGGPRRLSIWSSFLKSGLLGSNGGPKPKKVFEKIANGSFSAIFVGEKLLFE